MTIGDPRKAMLLGFVALGVVVFAIIRLIPRSEIEPERPITTADAIAKPKGQELPTSVLTNAFWHPRLEPKAVQKPITKEAANSDGGTNLKIDKSKGFEPLQAVDPGAIAGSDRELEMKPTIRLIAVTKSGTRSEALVEVGGARIRVHEGKQLDDLTIKRIETSSISVSWGKKTLKVSVGSQVELK